MSYFVGWKRIVLIGLMGGMKKMQYELGDVIVKTKLIVLMVIAM